MPRHIFVATTPPASAPQGVGHHYVDLTARRSYISIGTTTADDWKSAAASPETAEITLTPTNVANNYIELPYKIIPGSVMLFVHGLLWRGGVAYTVEDLSNSTRIHFIGELQAPGGDVAIEAGEVVTVSSLKL